MTTDEFAALRAKIGDLDDDVVLCRKIGELRRLLAAAEERDRLRAELAEWQNAGQQGHPTPCTLGPLCPYCEIERLRDHIRVMVEKAADKSLDGYRELGQRAADAENRIDAERARAERAEKEAELQARATEDWHARWQRACDRLAEESARAERLAEFAQSIIDYYHSDELPAWKDIVREAAAALAAEKTKP